MSKHARKRDCTERENELLEAPDNKATVRAEQKPTVTILKFKRDFKISGQIGDV